MQKRYVQFCLFIVLVICTAVGCSSGSSSPQAIVLDKTELVASLRKLLQEQKISPNIAMKRVASNNYDISLSPTNSKFLLKRKNIIGNNANEVPCCTESSEIKNDVPCCSNEQPSKSVVKPVSSIIKQHRFKLRPKLRGSLRKDGSDDNLICLCQLGMTLNEIFDFFIIEEGYEEGESLIDSIYPEYFYLKNFVLPKYEENSSANNVLKRVIEEIKKTFEIDDNAPEDYTLKNITIEKIKAAMESFETIFQSIVCPCRSKPSIDPNTIEELTFSSCYCYNEDSCGCDWINEYYIILSLSLKELEQNTDTNISTSTADINRKPNDSGYYLDFTDLNNATWTLKIPSKESYVNFLSPTEATISGYVLESNVKFTFHMIRESAADNYEWLIDDIRTEETNEYIIEGTIVDSSKSEVIPNATITISNKETYSDNLGRFTINLPQGEYDAVITAVGYATQTIRIQVPKEN